MPPVSPPVQSAGVSNGNVPKTSRVYGFTLNLVSGIAQSFDLRPLRNLNQIKEVQGIFIDNSANALPASVTASVAQTIVVPPQSQGVYPLYLSADDVLILTGSGTVRYILFNFPTPAANWSAASTGLPVVGGLVQTQDVALDAAIQNGALNAGVALYGNGDAIQHKRGGIAYNGELSAAATTVIVAGSPSAFISSVHLALSPDATLAAAGIVTVTAAFTNAGTIFSRKVYVPLAATNSVVPVIDVDGLSLIGTLGGDSFSITLSTAFATGGVEYFIVGGTTGLG